jgi:hypothetical protein
MSHFLTRLVERARGTAQRVEPIIAPLFAPAPLSEISEEVVVPTQLTTPEIPLATETRPSPPPLVRQQTDSATRLGVTQKNSIEVTRETLLVPLEIPEQPAAPAIRQKELAAGKTALPRRSALPPQPQRRPFVRQSTREPRPVVSAHFPAAPAQSISEPPIVRVTIGRIDVRAAPAPAAATRKTAPPSGPKLTLDAYLKARKERAR